MSGELTHWKKNLDSKYISGEDLQSGLKGLSKEMVVVIDRFEDTETFDQNQNQKVTKTGFWLKQYPSGTPLYKPVILNKVNADFCIKEFNSPYIENWIGKPFVLYAKPDKRHGFVARFKKYYAPAKVDADKKALTKLDTSTSLDELKKNWDSLSPQEKNLPTVLAKKEELKNKLA